MHEMALTNGILQILQEQARSQGFSRVRTVWLEIGALSSAEPEAMRFCFDAVCKGDPLTETAVLEIVRPAGEAWCMDCCEVVEIAARHQPCPRCDGHKLQVTGGEQLRVKELEVE
ncbi:hydrogenase maturation nickel metallochaperone HypA [Insolitispirillum peregrinum]|uniref:hydrogenase maturation nickel metallochaperone HypA n=1 Tax=Insolitispirillum peregrinum TaxID=80876 RepID=UPI00361125C5